MTEKRTKLEHQYNLVKLKDGKQINEKENVTDLSSFGKRHIQVIILFLSLSVAITMRAHLSVTVVAMTDHKTAVDFRNTAQIEMKNDTKAAIDDDKLPSNTKIFNKNNNHLKSGQNETNVSETELHNSEHGRRIDELKTDFINLNGKDRMDIIITNITLSLEGAKIDISNDSHHYHSVIGKNILTEKIIIQEWSVFRIYDWSKSTQEMITGSFFVGYTSMQLPMGIIAHRFGGKAPILVGLFVNAVLSIITPWVAIFGWWAVCSCRLLQGMTQAAFYPGIHTILGKWAPVNERGRLSTYIYAGSQFGTIIAFQMAGFLAGTPSLGWPSTFWVCGLMSFGCFILLWFLGAASPAEHPTISESEKQYIMGHNDEERYEAKHKTPWKSILTSVPVWAMIITHAGSAFGYIFLLIEMPVYMNHILHVNIKNNGLFSSLPYLAMYIMSIGCGHCVDFVINRGFISVINARRLANTFGMVFCALLMLGFAYAKNVPVAVTMLVLCMATHSGVQVGFMINQIDLTPNFAGTLMSLGNVVANFVGLAVPVLVSVFVKDVENQSQWQIVIWITAAIMIITNTVFVVFIKVDVQPWNDSGAVDGVSDEFQYEKIGKVLYATSDEQGEPREEVNLELVLTR